MHNRPVKGIDIDKIEPIEKDMIGFNNLIKPFYYPKTSIEEIDGKKVFVIWAHGGLNRPYEVPECVTAKEKKHKLFIRYNSSSIEAKGDLKTELFDLTARIPFDDMPNQDAKLSDISRSRVFDYLNKIGSKLTEEEGLRGELHIDWYHLRCAFLSPEPERMKVLATVPPKYTGLFGDDGISCNSSSARRAMY